MAFEDLRATKNLRKISHFLGVASGKGGVGKSTSSWYLALALRAQGLRVGVMDLDVLGPSMPLLTQAGPLEVVGNQALLPAMMADIAVASCGMFQDPHAAPIMRGPMTSKMALELLSCVRWGKLDYLILDYPPGGGDIPLSLAQSLPVLKVCIITTPHPLAVYEAEKTLQMFASLSVEVVGLIETMSYFQDPHSSQRHYIFGKKGGEELAAQWAVPFLASIPLDAALADRKHSYQCAQRSPVEQAYEQAAYRLHEIFSLSPKEDHMLTSFALQWRPLH